ncbi:MAG: protein kinase, partial [Bryobacteraceae bacterium]
MQGELENDELVMMLVESALSRPPEERENFLQSLCSGTPGLYDEVRKRIEWEERMGGFLQDPLIRRVESAADPFEAGELVSGRFRIVRVVGRGGMGVVYEALDERLDRRIAVKCAQVGFQSRLPPEARSAREVSHYNVCKVHELHTATTPSGEVDFITMEFVDGETLSQRIARDGPLKPEEAREIALQLCAGLAQAHRQGVVHGDLKCANVILTKSSDSSIRAVLTDFGLARLKVGDGGGFGRSERGGTLDYMAPELFLGEPMTFASDLYALGVVFHIMLTGKPPARLSAPELGKAITFAGSKAATVTLAAVREMDWLRDIADLPSPWRSIVTRCLAADAKARYGSTLEVAAAISPKRRALKWVLAAALTLVPAAGFNLWQWQQHSGEAMRLVVLPPTVEGAPIQAANGIIDDVASRLSGAHRNLLVIPSAEAKSNKVDTPEKAKSILGATHVLETSLRSGPAEITAYASIVDAGSGLTLRELKGSYAPANLFVLGQALTAAVTGALRLHGATPTDSVSQAGYADYVQGMTQYSSGISQADAAIASFNKAAAADPQSPLPPARIAEVDMLKFTVLRNREWLDRADEAIAKAQSINPDSYLVLYLSGGIKKERGQYEQAAQDYRRAIEVNPLEQNAWRNLAAVFASMNQPDQAIATYKKAIEAEPGNYAPYSSFGGYYYSLGQYQQAEQMFRRAVELAPSNAAGLSNLGLTLREELRFDEAEKALKDSLAMERTPATLSNLGAIFFAQSKFQEASQYFEQSLEEGAPTALRVKNLGDAYLRLGRSAESTAAYRRALLLAETEVTQNPRLAYSRSVLASIAANLGDANRAEFEMAQALQMDPQNVRVRRRAVLTYEVLKNRDKSLQVLRDSPKSLAADLSHDPSLKELQKD